MLKTGTWLFVIIVCGALSLLKGSQVFDQCPICHRKNLEVIPVEDYENYKLEVNRKRGLSIEFTDED